MANIFRPSTWLRSRDSNQSEDARENRDEARMSATEQDRDLAPAGLSTEQPTERAHVDREATTVRVLSIRERIEKRAYEKWCDAGCPHGQDKAFWLAAETELLDQSQGGRKPIE